MTLIDLFRHFAKTAEGRGYPPSARCVFMTLLNAWNEQRRPSTTTLKRSELITRSGLPETSFRRGFQYLADRAWVKRLNTPRSTMAFEWRVTLPDNGADVAARGANNHAHATETEQNDGAEKPPQAVFPTTNTEVTDYYDDLG